VDAASRGLEDGTVVTVASRTGAVAVPARITSAMMQGVVSLPHGYGHGREGARLSVAADHAGASINDLTDPSELDVPSGNAVLSGIPVRVERGS
jgi:anaerobic selenocysteine-containing dehydrogenase